MFEQECLNSFCPGFNPAASSVLMSLISECSGSTSAAACTATRGSGDGWHLSRRLTPHGGSGRTQTPVVLSGKREALLTTMSDPLVPQLFAKNQFECVLNYKPNTRSSYLEFQTEKSACYPSCFFFPSCKHG